MHGCLKTGLKKNKPPHHMKTCRLRILISAAAFFIFLLDSCAAREKVEDLHVSTEFISGQGLAVIARWGRFDFILSQGSISGRQERELIFVLTVRNQEIFAARKNYLLQVNLGYDLYNEVYYFEFPARGERQIFYTREELQKYLDGGMRFIISPADLEDLGEAALRVDISAKIQRLRRDSFFFRWFRLFNFYEVQSRKTVLVDNGKTGDTNE